MIEGQGSDSFATAKKLLYSRPDLMHHLLAVTATAVTDYLNEQIRSGAQAVMVFDTWGGLLSAAAYRTFSLAYMTRIMAGLIREHDGRVVPRIAFTKGGGQWLERIADCGCDAVGLDWTTDIGEARERVGRRVALQGNFDPAILMSTPEAISAEATRIVEAYGPHPGHVFNLGHGIWQQTPPEHVRILVDRVRAVSARPSRPASGT
jgi:uroporphyrinogen decarboxylase